MPINITSESEFNEYINSSKLTVVDFTAAWCGPCKMVAPRFEALSKKYPEFNFLKVDVDENRSVASTHGVRAMPTFMLFRSGKRLEEVVGADIVKVERLVESHGKASGGFPTSGGRKLGGSGPSGSSSSSSSTTSSSVSPSAVGSGFLSNLTPLQQQYLIFAGILLAFVYLYFKQQ
ncbi:thioredoxin-domain-containing protein [Zopfochytrium polystomum]|nr:thioredoxin-domain-containing protein [Zopfochytrium polystomum]